LEAKVIWQGGLKLDGTAGTGFHVPLSGEKAQSAESAEQGFLPMELFATGLAGCTAMDVISILQKKQQRVSAFEVQVHAQRSTEHPKVFTHAVIEYFVTGQGIDEAAVVRSIELSATRYCPAQAMFDQVFPIELKYHIYEVGDDDQPQLVKSGEYKQA
jgi:putative redox protein